MPPDQAADFTERAIADLPDLHAHLDQLADDLAERLREAHLRVREAAGQRVRRQITVRAQKPADVLGVYVYLPAAPGGITMTEAFASLKIVGGLLPADVIGKIYAGDSDVPGISAQTYGLEPGESVRRQASRVWQYLLEKWQEFKARSTRRQKQRPHA